MPFLRELADGKVLLKLHVQPGARKEGIVGLHGDSLKIKLTAPPVDGKANKAVILFLSRITGISKSAITLKRGQKSRAKQISFAGGSLVQIRERLMGK